MQFEFRGEMWHWRGPAPHHFVSVPEREAAEIRELAPSVTYGWGMSPATVTIGDTTWPTALWPKNGVHIVPVTVRVRTAEGIELGDLVKVRMVIGR
ncbi:MAG: DUF1905 domain-containing protein [Tepidiformaceae bacterium]